MKSESVAKAAWLGIGALITALVGCGGGGTDGCNDLPGRSSSLPRCTTGTGTQGGAATAPSTMVLSLLNSAGVAVTSITPGQPATLQALVRNSTGTAVPNAAVTFTTSDKTGVFIPSSGTALTDSSGVARVILPVGSQVGAFTITAATAVDGKAFLSTTNYSVTFPSLTFSDLAVAPATLSAGGTASLAVTVLNGTTPFTSAQSVTFTSPCVAAGKASISSPVTTVNGVASTSYADKGCGGTDTVTASTTLSGATITKDGTVNVQAATAGQVTFVSALPQNIALKGTGGAGRQETSTVVFKVLDKNSNPVSGQVVNFALNTTVGGLALNPLSATTGADGTVTTVVAAGTVNTPVRITATLQGKAISTLSDQLVVSTGVPDQNSFSLSTKIFNVEGMQHDGCLSPVGTSVTVRLADHFNNPSPDGTAVSFTAEGGAIDASCLTGFAETTLTDGSLIKQKGVPGECTVRFCAAQPRPADGRITILAYALGEEDFTDINGNNLVEAGEFDPLNQDLGEPFRNDRAIYLFSASDVRSGGETFIDSNGDGVWNGNGDNQYNGVLKSPSGVNTELRNTIHVRGSLIQVLSGSTANITSLSGNVLGLSQCQNGIPFANVAQIFRFGVRDTNPTVFGSNALPGNILPAGTKIEFTVTNGKLLSEGSFVVPNTAEPNSAVWTYAVMLQSDASQTDAAGGYICTNQVTSGLLNVKVITPLGLITTSSFTITD